MALHRPAAEPACTVTALASGTQARRAKTDSAPYPVEQPLMADDDKVTLFALHRAVRVSSRVRTSRPDPTPPGVEYQHINSNTPFTIREASVDEVQETEQKLKDDVDARVAQLQMQAAVDRRVAELRQQQGKG